MKYYLIFFKGGAEYGIEVGANVCGGDCHGYSVYTDKAEAEKSLKWWNEERGTWQGYYSIIEIDEKELSE